MITLLAIVHILIGLSLVLFVLLQDPKGGAMGVFSGGSSSSSFFGASGASNFLASTTKWLAILFAVSCLVLTYYTSKKGGSVMDTYTAPVAIPSSIPAPNQQSIPGTNPALDPKATSQPEQPAKLNDSKDNATQPTEAPAK